MRYSKRHGAQKTTYDHIIKEKEQRVRHRDDKRVEERADFVCSCGSITDFKVCPYCGGIRTQTGY